MQTHVNPLKHLAALSLLLLLAAAPLQQAHGAILGNANVSNAPGDGGTLRDEPAEEGQAAEDTSPAQEDAGGDPSAEAPDEAEPEAASDESSEPAEESEESADESEDSDDEDDNSDSEDE